MDTVLYEIRDKIAFVTINRPQAYNACDQPTYDRLAEVWQDFADNSNTQPEPADAFDSSSRGDLMRGLDIWKPIIAAVNGHCNGGGLEMALGHGPQILEAGPLAVRAIKQAATKGLSMPLDDGLRLESNLFRLLAMTEDSVEGTRAFAEKRPPEWKAH